jgi:glycogen debranching enzyme
MSMVANVVPLTQDCQEAPRSGLQPWLHDLEVSVHGNLTALCDRSGEIGAPGTGIFADDRRVVSHATLTCDELAPTPVSAGSAGGLTEVVSVARHLGDEGADPTVEVRRVRTLRDHGADERVTITSRASRPVRTTVRVVLGGDGADLADVKGGAPDAPRLAADALPDGTGAGWSDRRHRTVIRFSAGAAAPVTDGGVGVEWPVEIAPGQSQVLVVSLDVERVDPTPFDADPARIHAWDQVRVRAQDARLDLTVDRSLTDLAGLLLADPDEPTDVFAAAGTPWFLTLFGRDALWTARMTLPFGTTLAAGTLRTLARRQGTAADPGADEQPGKILHEVRRSGFADPSSDLHLPPVYFGTVDATPLWVCLLHDAWRWGMPEAEVSALSPHLERALGWMDAAVEQSSDGFLRYVAESGHGLSNQGWKDSGDSMRDRHGAVAKAPIALVETQAYAVQAALGAATLRESVLGLDGDRLRTWAYDLGARVREAFWVDDDTGPYLAMALDGTGAPVDGVGSNMGHTLGTGMLTAAESGSVASRITGPDLLGPYGIGTLGRANPAFNPIGYHTGSVWAHDTAICALGLTADGHQDGAASLLRALVEAASHFDYRLPELFGGDAGTTGPVPYPASCRPQAWAAATAGVIVGAVLGLRPDVPAGRLTLAPLRPSPFGAVDVRGLRLAGEEVSVRLDATGEVVEVRAPDAITVEVTG